MLLQVKNVFYKKKKLCLLLGLFLNFNISSHLGFFFLPLSLRAEEFGKDFKDVSVLKAFFPAVPTMAPTATAPLPLLTDLQQSLDLKSDSKIVARNPNRVNIYLEKKVHLNNHYGNESYDHILEPIANELAVQRENYPMTIIYLKLKCAVAMLMNYLKEY